MVAEITKLWVENSQKICCRDVISIREGRVPILRCILVLRLWFWCLYGEYCHEWLTENIKNGNQKAGTYVAKYSRMDQVKFVKRSRPYIFKIFKGFLPQILLGPFLNTVSHMIRNKMNRTYEVEKIFVTERIGRKI